MMGSKHYTVISHGHHAGAGHKQRTPVSHGHQPVPPQKPSLIPVFDGPDAARRYMDLVRDSITQAVAHWNHYGGIVKAAYASAWTNQERALKDAKTNIEQRKKGEEEALTFALNVLTVGVGGGIAGHLTKEFVEKVEKHGDLAKRVIEVATDMAKEGVKKSDEALSKYATGEVEDDPFRPPSITPAEFGGKVEQGIYAQTAPLTDALVEVDRQSTITLASARNLAELVCTHPFIVLQPKINLDEEGMRRKASLALWIGWGWARDVPYWTHSQSDPMLELDRLNESVDLRPIYKDLERWGEQAYFTQYDVGWRVRQAVISSEMSMPFAQAKDKEMSMIDDARRSGSADDATIDMERFIQWSKNPVTWLRTFGVSGDLFGVLKNRLSTMLQTGVWSS
jgi:hypothetical protein